MLCALCAHTYFRQADGSCKSCTKAGDPGITRLFYTIRILGGVLITATAVFLYLRTAPQKAASPVVTPMQERVLFLKKVFGLGGHPKLVRPEKVAAACPRCLPPLPLRPAPAV